jgi:glycosyltransferase involved in cell wall biosynthesis
MVKDQKLKVALVHDYLNQIGGAEKVFKTLLELFPEAPVYTLLADKRLVQKEFPEIKRLYTSFLQNLPFSAQYHRYWMWLMPYAVEQWQLNDYDLVISDSASYAKGIITGPTTLHLNYCHTPTRYLWHEEKEKIRTAEFPRFLKKFMPPWLHYQRMWDFQAAQRADIIIANSYYIRKLIKKFYKRSSTVIYPPVEIERFQAALGTAKDDYFLLVGRLLAYKRFDLAIEAAKKAGFKLKVAGTGRDYRRLKRLKGAQTEFLGFVPDNELPRLYAEAQALIFPQVEDFGISAVEALAAGTPVIAFRQGGACEIIKQGETGLFFDQQTPQSLAQILTQFNPKDFSAARLRESAVRFSKAAFKTKIKNII